MEETGALNIPIFKHLTPEVTKHTFLETVTTEFCHPSPAPQPVLK